MLASSFYVHKHLKHIELLKKYTSFFFESNIFLIWGSFSKWHQITIDKSLHFASSSDKLELEPLCRNPHRRIELESGFCCRREQCIFVSLQQSHFASSSQTFHRSHKMLDEELTSEKYDSIMSYASLQMSTFEWFCRFSILSRPERKKVCSIRSRSTRQCPLENLTGREVSTVTSPLHPTNPRCWFHASHQSALTAGISCLCPYQALQCPHITYASKQKH